MKCDLLPIRGLYERTSPAFRRKLCAIAFALGMNANHIAAVMASETGFSFSPSIQNPQTRSTGLIQFMPATAKMLGTSIEELAEMSAEDQLDYVGEFYRRFPFHEKLNTPGRVYMATFVPDYWSKPPEFVIFEYPEIGYRQNKGFDRNGDGQITVGEVSSVVELILNKAAEKAPIALAETVSEDHQSKRIGSKMLLLAGMGGLFLVSSQLKGHRYAA